MRDLKKYLDELAGPDHPFVKGVAVAGLMVESREVNEPGDSLSEATRLALIEMLRLN
jgi:hypothetical protein